MGLFKKLFKRRKKKPAQKDECWFNNPEAPRSVWQRPIAPEAPWSDNSVDNAETMKMAKR